MTETPPALRFDAVRHAYRGREALRGISLAVAPGEVVALLGPSGCGKTTLLRVAAGLERPTAGRVVAAAGVFADATTFVPPERRGIGLVFQDWALFPHLDVAANVAFGLADRPAAERRAIVADLLGRIGLPDRASAYPHMLSGGEQQRVALARALARRPSVLLMDEPFSNLDQRLRRGLRAETARLLAETGAAAVLVTHDPDDAMAVADRIALMRAGELVQVGTPEEIFRAPVDRFAAEFFTDLVVVAATVRAGRAETPFGLFEARRLADGPAIVCVRRDAFSLGGEDAEFSAHVLATRFLGTRRTVTLAVDGIAEPIEAHVDAHVAVEPCTRVGVGLDRREVFVFANRSGAPRPAG
jgi:iron(III) transport system ATP-binding protein